jgi:LysM repeat protein
VTNPQVAGLQVALRSHGFYAGPIDGVAGPMTARSVRTFQRQAGLKPTGIADLRTRIALGRLGRPLFGKRVLQRGMVGWDISVLQFLLAGKGFPTGITDGYFGGETVTAVRRYQRAAGLGVDGVAGARTLAALSGLPLENLPRPKRRPPRATYIVRPGDTLTGIAARFGTTLPRLARLNKIDPREVIVIGTKLRVPVRARATRTLAVRSLIDHLAARYGVNRRLARALAWQESGFQTDLTSTAGAWGVMQILPETWDFVEEALIGEPVPRTTEGNVRVGILHLRHLLRVFDRDERLAIGAWYQGVRAVRRHGLYPETEHFVANVLALKSRR